MEFPIQEAAYGYYNHYAWMKGFSIWVSCYYYSRKTDCATSRKFVGAKQGKKELNDKRKLNREIKR